MTGENEETAKIDATQNIEGEQPESKPENEQPVKIVTNENGAQPTITTEPTAAEDQATAPPGEAAEEEGVTEKPAEPEPETVEGGEETVEENEAVPTAAHSDDSVTAADETKEPNKEKPKGPKKGAKKGTKKKTTKPEKGEKSAESLAAESSGPLAAPESKQNVEGKAGKGKKGKGKKKKESSPEEGVPTEDAPVAETPEVEEPIVELTEEEKEEFLQRAYESEAVLEKKRKGKKKGKTKKGSTVAIKSDLKITKTKSNLEVIAEEDEEEEEGVEGGKEKEKKKGLRRKSFADKKRRRSSIAAKLPSEESLGSMNSVSTTSSSSERKRQEIEAQEEVTAVTKKSKKGKGKQKRPSRVERVSIKTESLEPTESMLMLQEMQKIKSGLEERDSVQPEEAATVEASANADKKVGKKKGKVPKKTTFATDETGGPEPPKKGKRMSHKQMAEWLLQQEQEAQRKADEEKKRLEKEKETMIEQEMIGRYEQISRKEHLQQSIELAKKIEDDDQLADLEIAAQEEWERYLRCDGLPKVTNSGEMYTYLYRINLLSEDVDIEKAAEKTNEILGLLTNLEKRITHPLRGDTKKNVEAWKEIRQYFRNMQQERLDIATYRLLRDVHDNLQRESIPLADFSRIEENFIICLWVAVELPIPMFNPRRPPKPRASMDFHEMEMKVLFPQGFNYDLMAVRGMYLRYDHLSDICASYDEPEIPEILQMDLNQATEKEYILKMKTSFQFFERKKKPKRKKRKTTSVSETGETVEVEPKEAPPPPEPEISVEDLDDETLLGYGAETPITVAMLDLHLVEPTVQETLVEMEDLLYQEALDSLKKDIELPTINLRQYIILGGLYFVDLYYQPTQPREFVSIEGLLFALQLPKKLQEVDYYAQYVPPNIQNDGTKSGPEIQEEELKYQEAEFEKLVYVTLNLPKHIIWMAPPKVCQWDKTELHWTTKDIYGEKYNEEKQFMEFRTGKFGIFGMAVYRFPNLPYQSWDILPQKNGQVMVRYTTAILAIDFLINEDQICLYKLKNSPNNTADHIVGIYCKLPALKQMMLQCGIDIFPSHDTFLYVKGTCQKHWPMEKHLYYNIGMLHSTFNFSWSRWNVSAGRRSAVFQMREYLPEKVKQISYSMVLVTPLKATLIDCTEVSSVYNEETLPNIKFCPDLTTLIKATTPITTRMKLDSKTSLKMARTLANLLIETKIFSFS